MKILPSIIMLLLLTSCGQTESNTQELNQRITRLEQRMDSLTKGENTSAYSNNHTGEYINKFSGSTNNRCAGITKKGTQCKRKAKSNGYCWQHGR